MSSARQSSAEITHPPARVIRRVWKAPREHGGVIIEPAWSDAPEIAQSNRELLSRNSLEIGGLSWPQWRSECRQQCIDASLAFLKQRLGKNLSSQPIIAERISRLNELALIVGGHQPELFHPGVWAKNIAIHRLAAKCEGLSLHLIVDNDVSAQSAILVPAGTREQPWLESLAFDRPRQLQPWESTCLGDLDLFRSFPERLVKAMAPWGIAPLGAQAWPVAMEQAQEHGCLVAALSSARVEMESRWGVQNLELPMSVACETPAFGRLVIEILGRLPEFVGHYNDVLAEYRELNGVRSHSHPVPELAGSELTGHGERWEAPFWVWRKGSASRDRLWAIRQAGECRLFDRDGEFLTLKLDNPAGCHAAIEKLRSLSQRGICLRSRALTTTLFARMGLADLFVHGFGGAKYDEMTDALMARFFRVPPPTYLTVSATLHLPLGGAWPIGRAEIGQARQKLRDLDHNPQRHINSPFDSVTAALLNDRQNCLQELASLSGPRSLIRGRKRRIYQHLLEANAKLAGRLAWKRARLQEKLREAERQWEANRVLRNRELSWTLYPEELVKSAYQEMFP